jgi:hypothetical protein
MPCELRQRERQRLHGLERERPSAPGEVVLRRAISVVDVGPPQRQRCTCRATSPGPIAPGHLGLRVGAAGSE